MLYLLCKYPATQRQLQDEIDANFRSELASSEIIEQCPSILRAIKETLRLYPPVYGIDKVAVEDVDLCGHFIPKGLEVSINFIGVHHDPNIWTNPEIFDIDRWLPERLNEMDAQVKNYAFLPFSLGSRDCVGKHFAYSQAMTFMYFFLRKYSVEMAPNYELHVESDLTVKPQSLPLVLKNRCK
jgi:cytochrome P450